MEKKKLPRPQSTDELRAMCRNVGDCWIWAGETINSGYGRIGNTLVHRLAFLLSRGHEAKGLVCHTCDVKTCANPYHLYDGTKSSNQKDAIARGLSKKPPRAPEKVNDELLRNAAKLMRQGASLSKAAKSIGVAYQTLQIPRHRQLLNFYLGR